MDKSLSIATAEFVTARVGYHGSAEPEVISEAYTELRSGTDRLRDTLTQEQVLLLRSCENAYHAVDGETARYYYKAGFGDAIGVLTGWHDQ